MRHLLGAQQFYRNSRIFYKENKIFRLLYLDICFVRFRYLSRSFQISVPLVSDICQLRFRYLQLASRISIDITSYIHRCSFVYPQMQLRISIDVVSYIYRQLFRYHNKPETFNLLFYNIIVVCIQIKTTNVLFCNVSIYVLL